MPKRKPLPPVERLWELYDYKPLTGEFVRKVPVGRPYKPSTKRLYRGVTVDGTACQTHRAVWKWVHGVEPGPYLDHINRDKHDNRIWNLREVTSGENVANRPYYHRAKPNTAGYYWCATKEKWIVKVRLRGVCTQKTCATEKEAQAVAARLRKQLLSFVDGRDD